MAFLFYIGVELRPLKSELSLNFVYSVQKNARQKQNLSFFICIKNWSGLNAKKRRVALL